MYVVVFPRLNNVTRMNVKHYLVRLLRIYWVLSVI